MIAGNRRKRTSTRVRISKSGQMTLPANARKSLGVDSGDYVDVVEYKDGSIQIEAARPLTIEELAGSLGPPPEGQTLNEYLGEIDRTPMVRSIYEGKREYDGRD